MDIESDDSERWEDFFGSSTELAPSLLGIYDTLTTTFDTSFNSSCNSSSRSHNGTATLEKNTSCSHYSSQGEVKRCSAYEEEEDDRREPLEAVKAKTPERQQSGPNFKCGSQSLSSSSSFNSHSSSSTSECSKSRDSLNASGNSKHRNNIRVLSANVQRIITHSDAEPVDSVDIDALNSTQSPVLSPVLPQRHGHFKKTSTPTIGHKVKLSHIPLSKITGKLTQAGPDLVDTFDASSEYLDALNYNPLEKKSLIKKPSTPAIIHIPSADGEKTPTNKNNNHSHFTFDTRAVSKPHKLTLAKSDSVESIKLIEMEKLSSQPIQNSAPAAKDFIVSEPLSPTEIVETINYALISQNLEQLTLKAQAESKENQDSFTSVELIQAINKPLISKPLVRSSSAACAATVTGSPLLTYARAKSLANNKAKTLGGAVPLKLPTAQQLEELEEASKMSAESLDRLTDIKSKFSSKDKISYLISPDIAKLKHRPLSSSSICSTSSSSSSGSDQLNGKQATSYLASIESLADQSESELMDPHTGMTVFERACREIVDSERSYVADLGQVIRGYLQDWKERACLRQDELKVLFANIEEIYDFNSTLLKQLSNSDMDPLKLAKCFIDLRERFDVYTTYCTSYPEAISLLTKLLQATHTNALLTSTQKMLQHTLPLGSYLLKPVQRILKYHLLLDNLRKHCDVKEVFQAYEIMRQVARNIDQVKKKLEQQSRVKELSGILDGWLGPELTVLGELRHEGLLLEHNKPRMVLLFSTMLIITKPKEDQRLQFKSYIHQNNLMLSEHLSGEPTSFYVIPYDEPRNQIKLTAKNRDVKRVWTQHIKGVMLEKFENISSRAKELVYKLGDEEDRTPDKNTWKWSLHSASPTPVYLERRNQYRRSEIRNRTKLKRKTVANSSSSDFNEIAETTKESLASKSTRPLSRNNSMDDTMLPALQKLAAAVKTKHKTELNEVQSSTETACKCETVNGTVDHTNNTSPTSQCACILRNNHTPKSPLFGNKALKERSKSVPRISFAVEELDDLRHTLHGSATNLDSRKSKSNKSVEIKQYNHKTMPKRIANLKKQKFNKKETSKFYMDLHEFDESTHTVLKITESTENLLEQQNEPSKLPDVVEHNNNKDSEQIQRQLTPAEKAKQDAQIILDLLKNNKEFDRIYKKPQKKRSQDSGHSTPTSPEPQNFSIPPELPPRPPSRSPPPLELEAVQRKPAPEEEEEDEPIYESLLRNVHVPYKFPPRASGANPAPQYYAPREKKPSPAPRPESDYVTLIYTPDGMLQQVGDETVNREQLQMRQHESNAELDFQRDSSGSSTSSSSTLKRHSQKTVISLDCSSFSNISEHSQPLATEAIYARPMPKNLMKRLLSGGSSKSCHDHIFSSESSLLPRARKSIDNLSLAFGMRSNKPPERRVSDVTEMCRQSILHRQGSEAVGERMANVDYADPRTLFSVANSEASLQRDSVFSLTSSSDSVCDSQKRSRGTSIELSTNFEYEDDVEACLENDFRDSAIYSDDNEKRGEHEPSDCVKPRSFPPQVPPKQTRVPPGPGAGKLGKPARFDLHTSNGSIIVCPPHLTPGAARSWVLQQIDNFNK